jgi:hypothetical protein
MPTHAQRDDIEQRLEGARSGEKKREVEQALAMIDGVLSGLVTIGQNQHSYTRSVGNLHFSECYNCRKVAVWVHRSLVSPLQKSGPKPNADLPGDIVIDFEEARSIVGASPRGAAALMRLVVQKLCSHLGENGNVLNEAIASLVAKGLSPLVQKSLDVVRVIGNESVHPGELDIRDDHETAQRLFVLVNLIAEQMISHPRQVDDLYGKLPSGKLAAIEARNKKSQGSNGEN